MPPALRPPLRTALLPLLPVLCGLLLLVLDPVPLQGLRHALFDQYQRWQPRVASAVPVRVVDIDDASLARLGQWPWPRTRLAELLARLQAADVASIGFDVVFAEADRSSPQVASSEWPLTPELKRQLAKLPDHDAALASRLGQSGAILGFAVSQPENPLATPSTVDSPPPPSPARFIEAGAGASARLPAFAGAIAPIPALAAAAGGHGGLAFIPDRDGVVRRVPLALRVGGELRPTLVSETLRSALATRNLILRAEGGQLREIRIGDLNIPTTTSGELWVHYSAPDAGRRLPAWQVLAGQADPALLAGHIVLIGTSASGLMDLRFTPLGQIVPGIDIHAQALEQILAGQFLQRPAWATAAEALALFAAGLLAGLLALRRKALFAAALSLSLAGALFAGSWLAFHHAGLLLDAALPALTVLAAFAVGSLVHHRQSEREQRRVRTAFARYVSPNRVAHLLAHPEALQLGGERRQCSFVFTDLAGFTALMEKIDPAQAVELLNAYLDEMIAIAFRHEGTLDRIVGDAVAIMFSAPLVQPDHAARALACAREMAVFADSYAAKLQARGIAFGHTRIGIHSGEVIVGNFGGKHIFDYRALGDPVNTAARLESVNKQLGTRLCVSAATLADCPEAAARPVGRLVLKGKSEALAVFEPLPPELPPGYAPSTEYAAAHALLSAPAADREQALTLFARLIAQWPDDPLVRLHWQRLQAGESGDLLVMQAK